MTIVEAIRTVLDGRDLTRQQAQAVAEQIVRGQASEAQIAGLLVALRAKGEAVDEILGFALAMRAAARRVTVAARPLVDTCGTGGDSAGTFNISTVAAFVAAGAGCHVAKHGNRSISSRCGSADVLAALGVEIEMEPQQVVECIEQVGVGFLYAPQYHPGARHAAGVRRELGVRTIFNCLGPLLNPAGADRQVIGVYAADLTEPLAQVLRRLDATHALVVHGNDGLDEITLCGPTQVAELVRGTVRCYAIEPQQFGLSPVAPAALVGGDATTNARIAREVLAGRPGPARDVVLLNAGAAIYVAGLADSIAQGVRLAAAAIDDGRAQAVLDALVQRSGSSQGV